MNPDRKGSFFNPHETTRAHALAGVPLASFKQRLAAIAIDFFLVYAIYLPAVAIFQYVVKEKLHVQEDIYQSAHVHVKLELERFIELAKVIWFILYFGLIVWKTNGLTPGKRLLHIRIASLTHDRITLWQAIERALGYGAAALEAGFGFFQYFIHPNHCCVHDRIAETIVVKEQRGKEASAHDDRAKRSQHDAMVVVYFFGTRDFALFFNGGTAFRLAA
jgi:uncharacterized RDD family membrane protein YckC